LYGPETFQKGTVRVAVLVGERMMLTVYRDPLPSIDASGNPQTDAKCQRHNRM